MGVTRHDIFGDAAGAQPATPGSYGERPRGYSLPDATRLGPVALRIADLARSLRFYEDTLGLRVIERNASRAMLAAFGDDTPLVALYEHRGARPAPSRGRLGLYHFAILLPDRPALGRFARHLGEIGARAGAADHLVSEAFYLQDPDNLGIEVYVDRPRSSWRRLGRELMMASDPLDIPELVRVGGDAPWHGMPAGTKIGHVHLHVGSLEDSNAFFSEALGFDRMVWSYRGALFLAAGGYHHHLGTNTWAGPGATPPTHDDARLLEWTMELPDVADVAAAEASLSGAGYPVEKVLEGESLTRDPWGTAVRLRAAGGARGTGQ